MSVHMHFARDGLRRSAESNRRFYLIADCVSRSRDAGRSMRAFWSMLVSNDGALSTGVLPRCTRSVLELPVTTRNATAIDE